ncbi:MAG: class I SAM-dependent methyltransferase [Defluviicoccus sp.]|nr:class I SAM-dependent methyltransferase [Defluviicoccus sp.]
MNFYGTSKGKQSIFHRWNTSSKVGDAIVPSAYDPTYITTLLGICDKYIRLSTYILSLGSGCGITERSIRQRFPSKFVVATDPFFEACTMCREKGIMSLACRAESLPFQNSCFDFILMDGVFGHLLALSVARNAALGIRRVLKPGGIAVIADDVAKSSLTERNPRVPYTKVSDDFFITFWEQLSSCDITLYHHYYTKGTDGIISRRIGIVHFS